MRFALLPSGSIILPPLPAWRGPRVPAGFDLVRSALLRQSPHCAITGAKDLAFVPVGLTDLKAAIAWSLRLQAQIGGFKPEGRDCDDFADAFDLAVSWMVRAAGIEAAPFVGCISVLQATEWAGVPAGGGHALNCVLTDAGLWIVEPQNGQACPVESYVNRTHIFAADGF